MGISSRDGQGRTSRRVKDAQYEMDGIELEDAKKAVEEQAVQLDQGRMGTGEGYHQVTNDQELNFAGGALSLKKGVR